MDQRQDTDRTDFKNVITMLLLGVGTALFIALGGNALAQIGNTTYTQGVKDGRQIANRP